MYSPPPSLRSCAGPRPICHDHVLGLILLLHLHRAVPRPPLCHGFHLFATITTITGWAPASSCDTNVDSANSDFLEFYLFKYILSREANNDILICHPESSAINNDYGGKYEQRQRRWWMQQVPMTRCTSSTPGPRVTNSTVCAIPWTSTATCRHRVGRCGNRIYRRTFLRGGRPGLMF